ncbi:MAG: hypothetical protein Q9195_002908 [Heterodermia aff. obscurata]
MKRAIHPLGPTVFRIAYPVKSPSGPSYRAAISTNSAIHRGLRNSTSAKDRNPSASRRDVRQPSDRFPYGNTRDGQQSDRFAPKKALGWPRVLRPNQQQKQDLEDMRESARARESAKSPRQSKYMDGGRTPSRYDPSFSSETSFRDRGKREQTATAVSRATERYAKTRSDSYVPPASNGPNRAARRFAIYGPGDTPPQRIRDHGRNPDQYRRKISSHEEFQTPTPRSAIRERAERNPDKNSRRNSSDGDYRASKPWSAGRERAEMSERSVAPANMYRGQGDRKEFASEERSYSARKARPDEWSEVETEVPVAIPYTTPASEFLYGTSVVSAALKYSRRKFYKFYCYSAPDRVNISQDTAMRKLASSQGAEVMQVQGEWLRIMDKMSTGRPHNGYILEASPLPRLPVSGLQSVEKSINNFDAILDYQSREDEAINGTDSKIHYAPGFARYPLILMLDGILDPGNLGALLRTAFFFGVDAVAISTRNCAPFSPVTLKASAGASESLKILSISQPEQFVDESQKNGWRFHAAIAPGGNTKVDKRRPYYSTSSMECPALQDPTVLMLGGEGEGLRANLRKRADFLAGVEGHNIGEGGVDSLNVSVAAGILCEAFLRKPLYPNLYQNSLGSGSEENNKLF